MGHSTPTCTFSELRHSSCGQDTVYGGNEKSKITAVPTASLLMDALLLFGCGHSSGSIKY